MYSSLELTAYVNSEHNAFSTVLYTVHVLQEREQTVPAAAATHTASCGVAGVLLARHHSRVPQHVHTYQRTLPPADVAHRHTECVRAQRSDFRDMFRDGI